MKTKYEKAADYFFRQMKHGLIKDDDQQEAYEIAIDVLSVMGKLIEQAQKAIDRGDMQEYELVQGLVREEIKKEENNCEKELNKFKELYLEGNKNNRGIYMSEMEKIFNIPMLNNEEYNKANKEVIELYRKFADWLLD